MSTDWIQTFTSRVFHPLRPDPSTIDIRDIAHSLSLLCRFNGHCTAFYSVADHSVRVSCLLPPELALAGLLHDAGEAYVSDLPRPVKMQMPEFDHIETRLLQVIFQHYGLPWPVPAPVRHADDVLLITEMRDMMGPAPAVWHVDAEPLPERIVPLGPAEAEQAFLARFHELTDR